MQPDVGSVAARGLWPELLTISGAVLRFRRCRWCGSAAKQSCVLCQVCAGTEFGEERSGGLGTITATGAPDRVEELGRFELRQPCLVLLDEGFTLPGVLSAAQYAAVPAGARVRVDAPGHGPRPAEFRLL